MTELNRGLIRHEYIQIELDVAVNTDTLLCGALKEVEGVSSPL